MQVLEVLSYGVTAATLWPLQLVPELLSEADGLAVWVPLEPVQQPLQSVGQTSPRHQRVLGQRPPVSAVAVVVGLRTYSTGPKMLEGDFHYPG